MTESEATHIREALQKLALETATNTADIKNLYDRIQTFVTKAEFGPIKLMTYGLAVTVMGSVVTSLVGKVLIR
jgi:hypothetical protein